MSKFELRSNYPCLIKWKGGEEFLEDGISLFFDEDDSKRLFVYPATGRREDVAFVLDLLNPKTKSFDLGDRKLVYLTKNCCDHTLVKDQVTVNGKNIEFEIGSNHLRIKNGEIIKIVEIERPKTFQLLSHDNYAILKLKCHGEEQVVAFDIDTNQPELIEGERIEVDEGEIICEKSGHEEKYIIADKKLSKVRGYEEVSRNNQICGMTFMQKLKTKKLKEACLLMEDHLSPSEQKLSAFFGEVEDFLPLSQNEFLIIKKSGYNRVRLHLNENKISNIEILD